MIRPNVPVLAVAIVAAWIIGAVFVGGGGEVAMVDTLPPPVYVVETIAAAVTVTVPVPLGTDLPPPVGPVAAAAQTAERGSAFQATETMPPPPSTTPQPVDGDCESWRPLLERYGIPFNEARPIMWRESRCTMAHNYNRRTRDDSLCAFQLNRWGALDAAWNEAGFSRDYMSTPEGCIAAVAFHYRPCQWGPWTKPYSCPGGWPL